MSVNIGGLLRSLIHQGLNDGVGYHDLYHAIAQAGVNVTSTEFAAEWRYAQGQQQNFVDFRGGRGDVLRGQLPDAATITESPVKWPNRFNARVQAFGRDLESGRFASRWINVGYDRLPTYGTIVDTAAALLVLGGEHYEFELAGISGVTVESSPLEDTG